MHASGVLAAQRGVRFTVMERTRAVQNADARWKHCGRELSAAAYTLSHRRGLERRGREDAPGDLGCGSEAAEALEEISFQERIRDQQRVSAACYKTVLSLRWRTSRFGRAGN